MSIQHKLLRASGSAKCRTVDVCDIFGDNSGKALYRLDGNANDESGNYHGTETAITYGGGVYERGAVFNGSSSKVVTPCPITSAFTLSFWIKASALPARNNAIFGLNGAASTIITAGTPNAMGFSIHTPGTVEVTSAGAMVIANEWTHIVLTCSSTTASLTNQLWYANASLQTTTQGGSGSFTFSTFQVNPSLLLNGSIDQVRIFNRAITATEVATLYAECAPTSTVTDTNPFMDGSLLNKCLLEGNTTSLVGTSPTVTGTVTYGTGKFGQCITGFSVGGSLTFSATGIKTVSMFIAPMTISGDRWIMDNRAVGGTEYFRLNSVGNYDFAGGLTVKKNGIPLATGTAYPTAGIFEHISIELTTARNAVHIGNVNTNNDGNSSNKIDHIELYNKVLTPMEVACLSVQTTPLEEPMHSLVDPFKDGSGKALYRLDGNALDESGNYNGTPTSVTYGAGRFGRAFTCDGTARYIQTTLNQSLMPIPFTYSVWFNTTTAAGGILSNAVGGVSDATKIDTAGVGGRLRFASVGRILEFQSTASVTTGAWVHAVVTWDGTTTTNAVKMYINGVLDNQSTASSASAGYNAVFYIGRYGTYATYFTGSVDQVRIFNRALTAGEVSTLYTEI